MCIDLIKINFILFKNKQNISLPEIVGTLN